MKWIILWTADKGMKLWRCYCAFHKHANSKVQKPPSQLRFSLVSIIITITSNEPWNTETHKTDRNPPITKHKPWPFEPVKVKFCFFKRSVKMIDGSQKANRQLAFELQNSHVCEKRSNNYVSTHMKIHSNSIMVCTSYALYWKTHETVYIRFILCSKQNPCNLKSKINFCTCFKKYMHAVKLFTTYDLDCREVLFAMTAWGIGKLGFLIDWRMKI